MALIVCPECGGKLSSYATMCPHCGMPKDLMEDVQDTELKIKKQAEVKPHDPYEITKFGRYPQGINGEVAPIEWLVVEKQKDKALLVSRFALDSLPFSTALFEDGCTAYVTWDRCSLRDWMNSEFLNTAFNKEEQERILLTTNKAVENHEYYTPQGEDSEEKVFLLSLDEVEKYFINNEERKCPITPYTKMVKNAIDQDGIAWWWLRTAGSSRLYATSVDYYGELIYCGGVIDFKQNSIRPAIWLSIPHKNNT